jgi:hypothetical protein
LCTAFPSCTLEDIVEATDAAVGPQRIEQLHLGNTDAGKKQKKKTDWSRAKFLESVRVLNASSIGGKQYAGVLGCPCLGSLEILSFGGCYHDVDAGFETLATATPPPKLRYLDLNGWKLTPEQAVRLVESPLAKQLWGFGISMYVEPETWRVFYDAGVPLVGHAVFSCDPASEHGSWATFREDTLPDDAVKAAPAGL